MKQSDFWKTTLSNAKDTLSSAFLEMVPLDEGAAHLSLWLFATAQDLGRFAPRPTSQHYGVAR